MMTLVEMRYLRASRASFPQIRGKFAIFPRFYPQARPARFIQRDRAPGRRNAKGAVPKHRALQGRTAATQLTARTGDFATSQFASMKSSTSGRMLLRQLLPAKMP